ncbi:hypothetical protein [Nocardiopsis sp. B62]|uniref:hypothetical protein n=1 Tax=Nocardiopsis sp. B62 TaxID=2824874 RepID=UPI001B38653B|nr:hypothetical protein [Nocardiopsis sp. B62]MBQ1080101.1 hypothetical protein [Nocardiopsis sp. B62]
MTSRLWWMFASTVAWALCQVIGAPTRTEPLGRDRVALSPAPRRPELTHHRGPLPRPEPTVHSDLPSGLMELWPEHHHRTDSLVRPYMPRVQRRPA